MSKDSLAYIITAGAVTTGLTLNGVLTTLILVGTLAYWIQKNYNEFKKN